MVELRQDPVEAVRHFSRFFTGKIGVLKERLLDSDFTPPEARVIFELGHHEGMTARDLAELLGLDPGYLSRLLGGLKRKGLVSHRVSEQDRRRQLLSLTESGIAALEVLEARSRAEIGEVLEPLAPSKQRELVDSLEEWLDASCHVEEVSSYNHIKRTMNLSEFLHILRPNKLLTAAYCFICVVLYIVS